MSNNSHTWSKVSDSKREICTACGCQRWSATRKAPRGEYMMGTKREQITLYAVKSQQAEKTCTMHEPRCDA